MKKARVLETMTIWSNVKHFSEIERQLSSCPRLLLHVSFQFNLLTKMILPYLKSNLFILVTEGSIDKLVVVVVVVVYLFCLLFH
jgi:hypothetical protein